GGGPGRDSVFDRVLHYRLQQQVRHPGVEHAGFYFHLHRQTILKPDALYFKVAPQKLELLVQRNLLSPCTVQREPQKVTQPRQHFLWRGRLLVDQRWNRVQRVKQKVRLELHLERLKLCLGELRRKLRRLQLIFTVPAVIGYCRGDQQDQPVHHRAVVEEEI